MERVVEELKEEIWELDTNNRFVQHKSMYCLDDQAGFLPRLSNNRSAHRNNLVFYGIREEAATTPEAAVRDVIKR